MKGTSSLLEWLNSGPDQNVFENKSIFVEMRFLSTMWQSATAMRTSFHLLSMLHSNDFSLAKRHWKSITKFLNILSYSIICIHIVWNISPFLSYPTFWKGLKFKKKWTLRSSPALAFWYFWNFLTRKTVKCSESSQFLYNLPAFKVFGTIETFMVASIASSDHQWCELGLYMLCSVSMLKLEASLSWSSLLHLDMLDLESDLSSSREQNNCSPLRFTLFPTRTTGDYRNNFCTSLVLLQTYFSCHILLANFSAYTELWKLSQNPATLLL